MAAYEQRWPLGTKQRTAYALMLGVGIARVDVHRMTWTQVDSAGVGYTHNRTGVAVTTEFGRPFTVEGFMRDAMTAAGLPLDCKPHGLRETLGRKLADAGVSAQDIMAALGHTTLAQAELYTKETNRRRGGQRAVTQLNDHKANILSQTASERFGESCQNRWKIRMIGQ